MDLARRLVVLVLSVAFSVMLAAGDALAICGDTIPDLGEQCDDGNLNAGDCCSPLCQFEPDDDPCDDGDACTQTDTCQTGVCTGTNPVVCSPLDQCHVAGVCDPMTGLCSNPNQLDGTACDDADACTQIDTCQAGVCSGASPVICSPLDQCHAAGTCDPMTGLCSNPNQPDGTPCFDGDLCTQTDTCQTGACVGANPVICSALDQCHMIGTCDPMLGLCSNDNVPDGTSCDDADACTISDQCVAGACQGNGLTCGDSVVQGGVCGETCDDGDLESGDGCDANCTVTACGNGIVTAGEVCDDGNLADADGCDSNCTPTACGNGVVAGGETCDDGNVASGDGCDANCAVTGCGNGALSPGEICDDGNVEDGDGCSRFCEQEILNPIPAAGDRFGWSVAALGASSIVGAPRHDVPGAIDSGVAYLFSGSTGALLRTFGNPTPQPGDEFGFSLAAVGTRVLVGAPFDDEAGTNAGAAYLFDAATGTLIRKFLNPEPNGRDHFGWSVAALGANVLIGAPNDTATGTGGAVYLMSGVTGAVLQVLLTVTPEGGDEFGAAVAALGANVLVGAPGHDKPPVPPFDAGAVNGGAVYLFDGTNGTLIRTFTPDDPDVDDALGTSVTALGGNVLAGMPGDDIGANDAGAVYLFNGATGAQIRVFKKVAPNAGERLGTSVAAAGTSKLVAGAPVDDGGAPNSGAAYLFEAATGAELQPFRKPVPVTDDALGRAVASLGSGRFAVGTPFDDTVTGDAGAVYVFVDRSCGDGGPDSGEQCDDGNLINGDGCDGNCTTTGCGNGIVTVGEACDDGNLVAADGCSPTCTNEGICGDNVVGPGEQCDDGDLQSGDGCDANCTPTGCGNGITTTGEECDEGASNGVGLCCDLSCQLFDGDLDGVCDVDDVCPTVSDHAQLNEDGDLFGNACDVCPQDIDNDGDGDGFCRGVAFNAPAIGGDDPCSRTNAPPWIKPSILIGKLAIPAGDEKMRLKGSFTVGISNPAIEPHVNGIHIRVVDKNDRLVVDERIPGGPFVSPRGWKAVGTPPRKWLYVDKQSPGVHNGIRKVLVKDLGRFQPNLFGILVKGKPGNYDLEPTDGPLTIAVELNDTGVPVGGTPGKDQCGETTFLEAPAKPRCEPATAAIKCK